ncbi:hypothetical protein BDV12DRAFT_198805 [Aspergillus spectabilis]
MLELPVYETLSGEHHTATTNVFTDIFLVAQKQGRYRDPSRKVSFCKDKLQESEVLNCQVLGSRRKVLGEDHPETLVSYNNLALVLATIGQHEEAGTLFTTAGATAETLLGAEHELSLRLLCNKAGFLIAQGRLHEARDLMVYVLEISEKELGADHSSFSKPSRDPSAIGRVSRSRESAPQGESHVDIQTIGNRLAVVLIHQAEYERAESLCLEVIASSEKLLGDGYQNALDARNNLEVVTGFLRGDDMQGQDSSTS